MSVLLLDQASTEAEIFDVAFSGDLSVSTGGDVMRARYSLSLIAVILVAFSVKLFFFSAPTAEAARPAIGLGLDVSNMHVNKMLPVQVANDLSFVFTEAD